MIGHIVFARCGGVIVEPVERFAVNRAGLRTIGIAARHRHIHGKRLPFVAQLRNRFECGAFFVIRAVEMSVRATVFATVKATDTIDPAR